MANTKTTYPFSIRRWSPPLGGEYKGILFSTGYWMELARASTQWRAEELVRVWRIVYRNDLMKILDLSGKKPVMVAYYPDQTTIETQTDAHLSLTKEATQQD